MQDPQFGFTAGPWQYAPSGLTGKIFANDLTEGGICHVYAKGEMVWKNQNLVGYANQAAFEANCRLIAAAPALAHALAHLVRKVSDPDFTTATLRENAKSGASHSALLEAKNALALLYPPRVKPNDLPPPSDSVDTFLAQAQHRHAA